MSTVGSEHRIVVGVDGSPSSIAALAWAAEQAERTGAVVEATAVWQWPANYGSPLVAMSGLDPGQEASSSLERCITEVARDHPQAVIKAQVVQGVASQVLVQLSRGADLLVVGTRGHGELVGALIGSVSEHCAAHATCTVVVVKRPGHHDEARAAS